MRGREQPRDEVEGRTEVVVISEFGGAGVDGHSNFDGG